MKLIFPNGEHGQYEVPQGATIVVGSGDEADVRLGVDGVAELHARIENASNGAFISISNAANITRVNGSLVVARTPLQGGDALLFGSVMCQVAGVSPGAARPGQAAGGSAPVDEGEGRATTVRRAIPRFLLRGVSGSTFGKHFPLYGTTVIGRHSECDICLPSDEISRKHARIVQNPDGLYVEDLDSANGTFVNGRRVRREKIEPGDELKLDTVRFLVEGAGGEVATARRQRDTQPAPPVRIPKPSAGGRGKWIAVGVLAIVAAAVGLKLAGVF